MSTGHQKSPKEARKIEALALQAKLIESGIVLHEQLQAIANMNSSEQNTKYGALRKEGARRILNNPVYTFINPIAALFTRTEGEEIIDSGTVDGIQGNNQSNQGGNMQMNQAETNAAPKQSKFSINSILSPPSTEVHPPQDLEQTQTNNGLGRNFNDQKLKEKETQDFEHVEADAVQQISSAQPAKRRKITWKCLMSSPSSAEMENVGSSSNPIVISPERTPSVPLNTTSLVQAESQGGTNHFSNSIHSFYKQNLPQVSNNCAPNTMEPRSLTSLNTNFQDQTGCLNGNPAAKKHITSQRGFYKGALTDLVPPVSIPGIGNVGSSLNPIVISSSNTPDVLSNSSVPKVNKINPGSNAVQSSYRKAVAKVSNNRSPNRYFTSSKTYSQNETGFANGNPAAREQFTSQRGFNRGTPAVTKPPLSITGKPNVGSSINTNGRITSALNLFPHLASAPQVSQMSQNLGSNAVYSPYQVFNNGAPNPFLLGPNSILQNQRGFRDKPKEIERNTLQRGFTGDALQDTMPSLSPIGRQNSGFNRNAIASESTPNVILNNPSVPHVDQISPGSNYEDEFPYLKDLPKPIATSASSNINYQSQTGVGTAHQGFNEGTLESLISPVSTAGIGNFGDSININGFMPPYATNQLSHIGPVPNVEYQYGLTQGLNAAGLSSMNAFPNILNNGILNSSFTGPNYNLQNQTGFPQANPSMNEQATAQTGFSGDPPNQFVSPPPPPQNVPQSDPPNADAVNQEQGPSVETESLPPSMYQLMKMGEAAKFWNGQTIRQDQVHGFSWVPGMSYSLPIIRPNVVNASSVNSSSQQEKDKTTRKRKAKTLYTTQTHVSYGTAGEGNQGEPGPSTRSL